MKNILLIPLFFCFVYSSTSQVDLTIDPVSPFFSAYNLGIDYSHKNWISTELGLGTVLRESAEQVLKFSGTTKFYTNPENYTDRFYLGVLLRYKMNAIRYTDTYPFITSLRQFNQVGVGILAGHKIVGNERIVFDANLGVIGLLHYRNSGNISSTQINLGFIGKLAVGYRFESKKATDSFKDY